MATDVDLDRILETIYRRQASACWLWAGGVPEMIVQNERRELQMPALNALDLERFVFDLVDAENRVTLSTRGHCAFDARYGHADMKMRVHVSVETNGYALSIHPLTHGQFTAKRA